MHHPRGGPRGSDAARGPTRRRFEAKVATIVVIYAENRAFDDLYGNFPGADGLGDVVDRDGRPLPAYFPQRDRDGTVLPTLPQTWGGVTAPGYIPVVTQAQSAGLPNAPFSIEHAFTGAVRRDADDLRRSRAICGIGSSSTRCKSTAARTTATPPGPMRAASPWGTTTTAVRRCSRWRAVTCSRITSFKGAFGGSFLNHQYLICACAPEYPNADTARGQAIDRDSGQGRRRSLLAAAEGRRQFASLGAGWTAEVREKRQHHARQLLRRRQVLRGEYHAAAVSAERQPACGRRCRLRSMRTPPMPPLLPPQTPPTIGDALDAKHVTLDLVCGRLECRARRRPRARRQNRARSSMRPRRRAAAPISSRITSPSTTTRTSIRDPDAASAPRT